MTERDDLANHDSSQVRGLTEGGIADHVEVGESRQTQRVIQPVAARAFASRKTSVV